MRGPFGSTVPGGKLASWGLVLGMGYAGVVTLSGGGIGGDKPGQVFGDCVVMPGRGWVRSACDQVPAGAPVLQIPADAAPPAPAATCGVGGIDAVLATIRERESGGNYQAVSRTPGATGRAAGAYQFLTTTWAGYGGYAYADQAPPAVQDAKAREHVIYALAGGDDVSRVPTVWYVGSVPPPKGWDAVPAPGNSLTPRQYRDNWMDTYERITGGCA